MSTILKFKCPDCGCEKLVMEQSVVKGYPVEKITECDDGLCIVDTTGEEIDINSMNVDEIIGYFCDNCKNYLIMDDDLPATEDKEVAEWIKKNCEQE